MDSSKHLVVQLNKDIEYIFQFTRWVFKPLGLWWILSSDKKLSNKIISFVLISINTFMMLSIIIPSSIHMIFVEKDLAARILLFGPIGFTLTSFIKYYLIIFQANMVQLCFKHIKDDWVSIAVESEENRAFMLKSIRFGRNLTSVCAVFMFSGGLSYDTIMPLLADTELDEFNNTIRTEVYPGYDLFLDSQTSPAYEIIYWVNVLGATATYIITTAACNLGAMCASHICGQVILINSRLKSLIDNYIIKEKGDDSFNDRISYIVQCHVRMLKFSKNLESLLRGICLIEVVASTLIICLLEYYCMTEWENSETVAIITYFMLLISLCFNIFIFCYIGEVLQQQCASIGNSAYMINWYEIPGNKGLSLSLIIAVARLPCKITAGGMMDLNLRSFGSIIKTSVAYLNMLRTMAE
ncbi:odorant receptor 85c-like [Chelonus insularis]|uniref:odorant receptor 85c-like n=1 Tax=Chelonus insularis TaxID=460826 RepID=UPI00158DD4A8|nr:odorant receptor 85c-like [Chelonus insularis]